MILNKVRSLRLAFFVATLVVLHTADTDLISAAPTIIPVAQLGEPDDLAKRFAQSLIGVGRQQLARRDFAAAERSFRKALQTLPSSSEAWEGLASVFFLQQQYDQVFQTLREGRRQLVTADADELDNNVMRAMIAEAVRANRNQEINRAEQLLQQVIDHQPNKGEWREAMANFLMLQGRREDAVESLRQARNHMTSRDDRARIDKVLGQLDFDRQRYGSAMRRFESAFRLAPNQPDIRYWLGRSYLQAECSLSALGMLFGAPTSNDTIRQSRELAIGSAFGQMALRSEARSYFRRVAANATSDEIAQQAREVEQSLNRSMYRQPYLQTYFRGTFRSDDNPGVTPVSNILGAPLAPTPVVGNLLLGRIDYNLIRDDNYDLYAGYSLLDTENYEASQFDLMDNAVYVACQRRMFLYGQPTFFNLRADYDYLTFGGRSLLQRGSITPSVTLIHDDWRSTTIVGRWQKLDFLGQGVFNATPLDADAHNWMVGFSKSRRFGPRRMYTATMGYQFDGHETQGSDFDYLGHALQAGLAWRHPRRGHQAGLFANVHFRDYPNINSVIGGRRDDDEFSINANAVYELNRNSFVVFDMAYVDNESDFAFAQFNRVTIDLGIEFRWPGIVR